MSIENPIKAYLRPDYIKICFVLGLHYVQDNADPILIVLSDDPLIRIGSIALNHTALFIGCFGGLMVLELNRFRINCTWCISK
jgi:hypothetical protein